MNAAAMQGRSAYERRAWGDAFEAFSLASKQALLEADDVERMAQCAGLTAHEDAAIAGFERLHQLRLEAGEPRRAARAAFWCAMRLVSIGETARANGWLGRARRLLEADAPDTVERGYLLLPQVAQLAASGDYVGAQAVAAQAAEIGARHGERDLHALGRCFEGRALIRHGRVAEGMLLLDEAMLHVTGEELSPMTTGVIYCAVIAACQQSYALDRAREWTTALGRWCDGQPQVVVFAGACLVHRSEILQLGGAWSEAVAEARLASLRLSHSRDSEAGNARYQEAELYRLRGELAEAEEAYTLANELGRDPQPGLALLRLAQGRVDLSLAATRRMLAATPNPLQRTRILPAHVEILLAAGELAEARQTADELCSIAAGLQIDVLNAIAQHANGAVTLAEGNALGALASLRQAQEVWQRVGAPYLSARVRVAIARAFLALGDRDGAALEIGAAKKVFTTLGAAPELAALGAAPELVALETRPDGATARAGAGKGAHGLSARELEVLRLVAAGKTNKIIARELFLSEKTVDRHLSNIFAKLSVPTRAAATAWAYQHGLAG